MVIVVGGGPAGVMAAIAAKQAGKDVCIIERNKKLLLKLGITGKGRCNITNKVEEDIFLSQFSKNGIFLKSSFYQFSNEDLIQFMESIGVPLKVERGGRVFPVSDRALDIVHQLTHYVHTLGITVHLEERVEHLLIEGERVIGVQTSREKRYGSVIVSTGGLSYPKTGSSGDGYQLAEEAGHTLVKRFPSLVPLRSKEEDIKELQGLSLKNVQVTSYFNHKEEQSLFGEMLFTHFGVSGPVILSLSREIVPFLQEKKGEVQLTIDLKPALTEDVLDKRLVRELNEKSNKDFANSLGDILPKKMIPIILKRSGISEHKKCHQVTKEERGQLLKLLKAFSVSISGARSYEEAVVTRGGVSLKEVNPKTMASKKIEGLYFCGEVLDLDAYTGGYNLQCAFSTGYAAGNGVREV